MDPDDRKNWWQVGRILASLPCLAAGALFLMSYVLSWVVFPWNREFIRVGMTLLLGPAVVLFIVGAIIIGWRHIWRTTAWLMTVLGAGALVQVVVLSVMFTLPSTLRMVPDVERDRTLNLVHRIAMVGSVVGALGLISGVTMLVRQRTDCLT